MRTVRLNVINRVRTTAYHLVACVLPRRGIRQLVDFRCFFFFALFISPWRNNDFKTRSFRFVFCRRSVIDDGIFVFRWFANARRRRRRMISVRVCFVLFFFIEQMNPRLVEKRLWLSNRALLLPIHLYTYMWTNTRWWYDDITYNFRHANIRTASGQVMRNTDIFAVDRFVEKSGR